jgi:hypothetical protein
MNQETLIKNLETKFKLNAVPRFEFDATLIDGKEPQGIWIRDDIAKSQLNIIVMRKIL